MKKKMLIAIAVIVLIVIFYIIGVTVAPSNETKTESSFSSTENSTASSDISADEGQTTDYLNKTTWAALQNYMFAVEVENFDGDIFEAGTYRFYPDAVNLDDYPTKIPVVWDIYISDKYYTNPNQLKDDEYVATVGGLEKDEYTAELLAGKYVYINYNKVLGEPMGMLQIEKQ